jgi:hypothetical protein
MSDHLTAVSRKRIGSGIRVMIAGVLLASSAVAIAPVTVSAEGPPPCAIEPYDSGKDLIEISYPGHLGSLSATPADWSKSFIQTDDIDLEDCNWNPIGYGEDPFTGSFDGGNYEITGLAMESDDFAGMFGKVDGASLSNIKLVNVSVTGANIVGGLIGEAVDATISASSVTGRVTGSDGYGTGGLIGVTSGVVITSSWSSATVSGVGSVGGLVGEAGDTTIADSYATGGVTGNEAVGGLVGEAKKTTISRSWAAGDVSGEDSIGGLVGEADRATISRSFATGGVTGESGSSEGVGGLVGLVEKSTISDSYALGNATIGDRVGGLVGDLDDSSTVERSYSAGAATGDSDSDVGGLVGFNGGSTVSASFWDVTTSAQSESAGGVGKSTELMKAIDTFEVWDIDTSWSASKVWGICDEANGGYPYLTWQFPGGVGLDDDCNGEDSNEPSDPPSDPPSNPPSNPPSGADVPLTESAPSPAPVPVNGAMPQNAPGEVTVFEDGQPVTVRLFVEDDTELVLQGSDFELRLSGECASGCTITETASGRQLLTLEENGAARTEGRGFLPGSKVDIWMFSEPRYLGQLTVRADGTFAGTVQLVGVAVGEHTLQVNGLSMSGAQRSVNLGVLVKPAQSTPALGLLPTTGADVMSLWWQALALIGVGVLALGSRRLDRKQSN